MSFRRGTVPRSTGRKFPIDGYILADVEFCWVHWQFETRKTVPTFESASLRMFTSQMIGRHYDEIVSLSSGLAKIQKIQDGRKFFRFVSSSSSSSSFPISKAKNREIFQKWQKGEKGKKGFGFLVSDWLKHFFCFRRRN